VKRTQSRALRIRPDARDDYAKLLSAIARWRSGRQLLPAEELVVRTICEDVAKRRDPTARFFEPVRGQPGSYRSLVVALDYLTSTEKNRGKVVGKRWNLSDIRVRGVVNEHKNEANGLIASIGAETSRAFVEQMLSLKGSGTR
jgi:hypothetical protein